MEASLKDVDLKPLNVVQMNALLLSLLQEKKGWMCLAKLNQEKDEEIKRLKETVVNFEEGMERAEFRANALQEDLERIYRAHYNQEEITYIKPTKVGLYLPSTMKQVIEMITGENVRLQKALVHMSNLPNPGELVTRNQDLERQVKFLQEKFALQEELINEIRRNEPDNQGRHKMLLFEKESLAGDVQKLKLYAKSLREKNTCLLAQLAESVSYGAGKSVLPSVTSQNKDSDPSFSTGNILSDEADVKSSKYANDSNITSESAVSDGTTDKCSASSTSDPVKNCSELELKCQTLERENCTLLRKLEELSKVKEEQERGYSEIVEQMSARLAEAHDQSVTYQLTFEEHQTEMNEIKAKVERLEREWRERGLKIKSLQDRNNQLSYEIRQANAQTPQLPKLRTNLPKEPYGEAKWPSRQGAETLVADSPSPVSGNEAFGYLCRGGHNVPQAPNLDLEEPPLTICSNCGSPYPSSLFEDHLKDCGRN